MHIALISLSPALTASFKELTKNENIIIYAANSINELTKSPAALELIIFDASLTKESIIRQIKALKVSVPWAVANYDQCIHEALEYLQAGATGVLGQQSSPAKYLEFIQSTHTGTLYIDEHLAQILAMRQIQQLLFPFSELTDREFNVFCLLAENYSISDIATSLGVSLKTAFNCQTQIRKKLDLANLQEIRQYAEKNGLVG